MSEELTPKEKAAILLICLGRDYSAQIYRHLSEEEIEQLTLTITSIRRVDTDTKESVVNEFYEICMAQQYISEGGIEYARQLLDKALGQQKAIELISKLSSSLQVRPFDFVRKADPAQIINFVQNEHPQTVALILSYLDPRQAATVVSELPHEYQTEVVGRIATMGATSPEYIMEAERILERRLSMLSSGDQYITGGIESVVDLLNNVDRTTERFILEGLEERDPELADTIRARMFVFEDITKLNNQTIQRVLREVDNSELALALKLTSAEVSTVIFNNVSKRMKDMLREDMEFMGPVRMRDVEEAQQRIVNIIRRLEETGEIVVARGKEDELVV